MLTFKAIENFKPGQIQDIIKMSYAGFIEFFPQQKEKLYNQWEQEDKNTFSCPDAIGKCTFFSCVNDLPVGYFSWDNRKKPIGIIGQNCILPKYRQQGYGQQQIKKIISVFKENNFNEIHVTTGNHPFFYPAQKMYLSCGFNELYRYNDDLFELMEYVKFI
jgi:GNAT superfamily N-acetyltransferase